MGWNVGEEMRAGEKEALGLGGMCFSRGEAGYEEQKCEVGEAG